MTWRGQEDAEKKERDLRVCKSKPERKEKCTGCEKGDCRAVLTFDLHAGHAK